MIFFKHRLITFTILVIAVWVMPAATSEDKIECLKGID